MRVKLLVSVLIGVSADLFAQNPFPYVMPKEKPTFKMSCAMNRVYDNYGAATPQFEMNYTRTSSTHRLQALTIIMMMGQ